MRKLKTVENVTYMLQDISKQYYLVGINNDYKLWNKSNDFIEDFDITVKESDVIKINENGIYFNIDNKIYKISAKTHRKALLYEVNSDDQLWIINEDFAFIVHNLNDANIRLFSLLNTKTNNIIWEKNFSFRLMHSLNYEVLMTDLKMSSYSCIDIISGDKKWEFILNENDSTYGRLLLHKNNVIIPTESGLLISIDIETGKKLWQLENCQPFYKKHEPTGDYSGDSAPPFRCNRRHLKGGGFVLQY